ncbi:N-acetyltransferase [Streptomyces sp. NPDC058947]|uniref:N-acetyltransferase n=1 Tax=Streptomyces sp. R02 TaxID=3238623 RepID=A0AB39LEB1_9ACTN|nr:N-acetyltransferase [Streptomyces pseudogriseolus]
MTTTVPFGLAEQTEIAAYTDFVAGAAAPLREALGIGSLHVGSALALAIREDPSRFFNRAGGFGAGEPITVDVVAQVCDFYRRQAVSQGAFMVAPPLQPPHWAATADKVNLTPGNRFVKLGCDIESTLSAADGVAALDPGLRVGPVEPHHAQEWATVMMTTFGFTTPGVIDMAASCVGRPNWRQYAVFEDERIIAVGSVFFNGLCADVFGGATLPEGRGRGAQSALLTARARAALAAGCRWLVAETGAEGSGDHNTSLHNMLRAGLEPLYERLTWLWRE